MTSQLVSAVESTVPISQITDLYSVRNWIAEQGNVIQAGIDAKTAECMRQRGFDYPGSGGPVDLTPVPTYPTPEEVATYGYYWRVRRFEQRDAGSTPGPSLSPDAQVALDGTEETPGCGTVAAVALDLDLLSEVGGTISTAASDITRRALGDSTYLAAVGSWVECMAAFGYAVPDLAEAGSQATNLPGGLAGAEAIQMAVRDYGCQDSVGLQAILNGLVAVGTQEWLEANPTVIDDYRRLLAEVVANAQAAVS